MQDWSAQQYIRFEAERNRPVMDLLGALPPVPVRDAIDVGCGPGNSTELLAARFPEADVSGFDSSPDMIAAARQRLPALSFSVSDVNEWKDARPFDLIFSNAVFQWVPDHEKLMPALLFRLNAGGMLAAQMPDNLDEPAHRLMRETALEKPWAGKLAAAAGARAERHSPDWYFHLLKPHCSSVDVWRTTYYHALPGGVDAIIEWFKGTGLRPFLNLLNEDEKRSFLRRLKETLIPAYPEQPDGAVLLPFPRLFFIARR